MALDSWACQQSDGAHPQCSNLLPRRCGHTLADGALHSMLAACRPVCVRDAAVLQLESRYLRGPSCHTVLWSPCLMLADRSFVSCMKRHRVFCCSAGGDLGQDALRRHEGRHLVLRRHAVRHAVLRVPLRAPRGRAGQLRLPQGARPHHARGLPDPQVPPHQLGVPATSYRASLWGTRDKRLEHREHPDGIPGETATPVKLVPRRALPCADHAALVFSATRSALLKRSPGSTHLPCSRAARQARRHLLLS